MLLCDCGFEARAGDEEGLVVEVKRHAREAHGMTLSHEDAVLLVFRAELEQHARPTGPRRIPRPDRR